MLILHLRVPLNHEEGGSFKVQIGKEKEEAVEALAFSEHGAGRSIDGLGQDVPATRKSRRCEAASPYQGRKEVSRKMRDTAGGTPALPFKKPLLHSLP